MESKITKWKEKDGLMVHPLFKDHILGIGDNDSEGDVKGKFSYDLSRSRMFNSFENAQTNRFLISMNWMRMHFQELEKKEGKRRKTVMDFGCSRAYIYQYWKNKGNYFNWPILDYIGIDSNEKRIREGIEMITKKKNDFTTFYLSDLSDNIKFEEEADVICLLEVLEHLPTKKVSPLINNIYNNLRTDGIGIISSPNPETIGGLVWGDGSKESHHYEYTWEEAKKIFEDHGFQILDQTGVLPNRTYRNETSYPRLRKRLSEILPPAMVNNILILAEKDMNLKRQWICRLKKI